MKRYQTRSNAIARDTLRHYNLHAIYIYIYIYICIEEALNRERRRELLVKTLKHEALLRTAYLAKICVYLVRQGCL